MSAKKKVYFYKLNIFGNSLSEDKMKTLKKQKTPEEVYEWFNAICAPAQEIPEGGHRVVALKDADKTAVDIISDENKMVFARIGKADEINLLCFRNDNTAQTTRIDVPDGVHAEKFTYFLIDFNRCIITFMSVLAAPTYKKLSLLFDPELNGSIEVEILPIANTGALKMMKRKDCISGGTIQFAVPPDSTMQLGALGLNARDFFELKGVTGITLELKIEGQRSGIKAEGDVPRDGKVKIVRFFEEIISRNGRIIKKASLKGHDHGENMKNVDLLNDYFTEAVEIPNPTTLTADEYSTEMKNNLKNAYVSNLENLVDYVR